MHKIFQVVLSCIMFSNLSFSQESVHSFTVKDITKEDFSLAQFKGKKVLIVNVASKCGLTPQYEKLQKLYDKYKDQNFVIVGFPANNFMGQEPGTNDEIVTFCKKNYGVSFPMMSKISVKGSDKHELYQWLTMKKHNKVENAPVTWNFQKFMIDENGKYVGHVAPRTSPLDEKIINWIEGKN